MSSKKVYVKIDKSEFDLMVGYNLFYKIATDGGGVAAWKNARVKTATPYHENVIGGLSGILGSIFSKMDSLLDKLGGTSPNTQTQPIDVEFTEKTAAIKDFQNKLEKAMIVGQMSGGISNGNIDIDRIVSYAKEQNLLRKKAVLEYKRLQKIANRTQRELLVKKAQENSEDGAAARVARRGLLKAVKKKMTDIAGKVLPKFAPRIAPSWVGTAFSLILTIKELLSVFSAYKKLVADCEEFGLTWKETLYAGKLRNVFEQHKEDPDKVGKIGMLCHTAMLFIRDAVEAALNAVDFSQDLLFSVLETFALGTGPVAAAIIPTLEVLNFSLSSLITFLDFVFENLTSANHSKLHKDILAYIDQKIEEEESKS